MNGSGRKLLSTHDLTGFDGADLDSFYYEIHVLLGGTGIEVELEDDDYDVALSSALRRYRTLSTNSIKYGWLIIQLEENVRLYTIPKAIDDIRNIYRYRSSVHIGNANDPFSAGVVQQLFTPTSGGAIGSNMTLVSYEALAGYQELVGRMFGEYIPFEFTKGTSQLFIMRNMRSNETVGLDVSVQKNLAELFAEYDSLDWLKRWTQAECMIILGEKYRKFATAPGAQAGTVLKGNELVSKAQEMKEQCEKDVDDFVDGSIPAFPLIG